MKFKLVTLLFVLMGMGTYAQTVINSDFAKLYDEFRLKKTMFDIGNNTLNNIKGSPYMDDEFKEGEVVTIHNKTMKGLLLRYNIYNDVMEIKVEDKEYNIPAENLVERVIIDGRSYDYLIFNKGGSSIQGYLELLYNEKLKLYCKHGSFFKEPEDPKPFCDPKPGEFERKSLLFLLKKDERISAFKNKKEFFEMFPKHEKELKNFIKKHKTKFNKCDDLIKLVEYCDSL